MGAVSSVFQPEGEPGVRTSTLDNTYFARGTHPPAAAAPSAPLRHLQSPHQSGFQPAAEEMYWLDELIKVQEGEQRELDAALEAPAQDVDAQLKVARELSNSGMPTSSGDEDVPRELNPGALVQRRQRGNRHGVKAGFFVSSPGAFVSTDTRDGGRYVSKVDRESTLHSQLPVGIPSLVCDIFSSKIMTTNAECNDLFECVDPSGQMMQMEFFHFVHEDDRDQVSQTMAYLLVSGHSELGEEAFKILTLQGKTRLVRMKGTSLSGTWWQLVFQWDCQPGAAAASSSS
jgi:hypothetical protein